MSISPVVIAGRAIGPGHAPFIVAEVSANHLGCEARALEMIDIAGKAGVDAVKLQTYTADTITIDHDGPEFVLRGGLWVGRNLYDLANGATEYWTSGEGVGRTGSVASQVYRSQLGSAADHKRRFIGMLSDEETRSTMATRGREAVRQAALVN